MPYMPDGSPHYGGSDRETERLNVSTSGATEASALAEDGQAAGQRGSP